MVKNFKIINKLTPDDHPGDRGRRNDRPSGGTETGGLSGPGQAPLDQGLLVYHGTNEEFKANDGVKDRHPALSSLAKELSEKEEG